MADAGTPRDHSELKALVRRQRKAIRKLERLVLRQAAALNLHNQALTRLIDRVYGEDLDLAPQSLTVFDPLQPRPRFHC
jgi:hypothetical protein